MLIDATLVFLSLTNPSGKDYWIKHKTRQLYLTLCLQRSTSAIVEMTPWLMAIFCLVTAGCSNVTDQQTSETHHDQQVAILKQIRKVNEDGSYTYGYEAGDGSFKVRLNSLHRLMRKVCNGRSTFLNTREIYRCNVTRFIIRVIF